MKDQNIKEDVRKILEEAPNARKALLDNYDNLLRVADYCHNSYLEVSKTDYITTYSLVLLTAVITAPTTT